MAPMDGGGGYIMRLVPKTLISYVPRYEDLRRLFHNVLSRDYGLENYNRRFAIRVGRLPNKIGRVWKIYSEVSTTPRRLFEVLEEQRQRLIEAGKLYGDPIPPLKFEY